MEKRALKIIERLRLDDKLKYELALLEQQEDNKK
jgi:hypothetical protein